MESEPKRNVRIIPDKKRWNIEQARYHVLEQSFVLGIKLLDGGVQTYKRGNWEMRNRIREGEKEANKEERVWQAGLLTCKTLESKETSPALVQSKNASLLHWQPSAFEHAFHWDLPGQVSAKNVERMRV